MKDKMIAAMLTVQSCKILSQSVMNHRGAFWHFLSRQTHESIAQTGLPGSVFLLSHRYLKEHDLNFFFKTQGCFFSLNAF